MSAGSWKVRGMKKRARIKLNTYVRATRELTCDVLKRLIDGLPESDPKNNTKGDK